MPELDSINAKLSNLKTKRNSFIPPKTVINANHAKPQESEALMLKIFQSRQGLLEPPSPIPDVNLPSTIPPEEIYRYAVIFPPYVEAYFLLYTVDKDSHLQIIRNLIAFLQTVRSTKPNPSEDPLAFYQRCMDSSDSTLLNLRERASDKGLTLDSYLNCLSL